MLRAERFEGIYLHRDNIDFRKSIDGLAAIVEQEMGLDVFGSHLFLFCNKNRTRLKVLYWDRTGFALWYKRLERERFVWPKKHDWGTIQIDRQQLEWLLSGYDVWKMKPHEKVNYLQIS
jgi:transposase